jgi:SpoVK/Ycf46/Vps4 family AAA+-type ATPase
LAADAPIDRRVLQRAVRQTAWADLSAVARYVENRRGWADLVVADHTRRQLHDIVGAIQNLTTVVDAWGFGERPGGLGLHLLFAGPSGTGKTLSASVVASECELDLWVVDLARVVDKYLGETEKQLDRVLGAAERCGAMLLFDEADALFGRRGEVREAKDRWANVEVAYLLQRIEQHRGVTVLTTNLGQNLDVAFARRMGHRVDFAMPDVELRRELWRRSVPTRAPVADEAAFGIIADRFELAGGAIRNAALNAAFAAAQDGRPIELDHLVLATVRELTKVGKAPTRSELADLPGHAALVTGHWG